MIVPAVILAASLVALGLIGAVAYMIRRTTIPIVIRKDPDMATIKERLAPLEAVAADHGDTLAAVATKDDVAAVADRVDEINTEIGNDPAPAPVATPSVDVDPALAPAPSPFG